MKHRLRLGFALAVLLAGSAAAPVCADSILVFQAPNTWGGQQGAESLIYRGVVSPETWTHYSVGSAFFDANEGKFIVGADATDSGGWGAVGGFHHSELLVGRSLDGIAFPDWQTLLWVDPETQNLRIYNLSLLPDPARPGVWFGVFSFTLRSGTLPIRVARIEVDNVNDKVRVGETATTWKEYDQGAQLDIVPHALILGAAARSFARVTVDGVTSYEIWSFRTVTPRSGVDPCPGSGPPPDVYVANTATDTRGREAIHWTYNPTTFALSGPFALTSAVRPMPTDYDASSISLVTRVDFGTREALFTGTTDQRICVRPDNLRPWSGSSVQFTRILKQPDGRYAESAATWFLDVDGVPPTGLPNWSCSPASPATCYAPTTSHYGFVGAYPVVRAGQVYFYVEVWGGFIPSPP